jgi:hypothetical protein
VDVGGERFEVVSRSSEEGANLVLVELLVELRDEGVDVEV